MNDTVLFDAAARHGLAWRTTMKINEGAVDRGLRIIVGLGILSLAFFGPKTPLGYLGLIPLLTGAIGYCPLYSLIGLNTCSLGKTR
jgi:hypothetical protein